MSWVERLSTLGEVQTERRATPKHELSTKLDRAIGRKAVRLDDAQQLRVWAKAVKVRDRWIDRKTGERLRSTRDLDPLRAEAHHVVSREDPAVRYDVRNGICLSFATHDAIKRHRLRIVGTVWFVEGGTRYIDAGEPVIFEVV